MCKLSQYYIFNFAHASCMFLIVWPAEYIRVSWAPSLRQRSPFRLESPIQAFQGVWVSILGECKDFGTSWMSLMENTNVRQFGKHTPIVVIRN